MALLKKSCRVCGRPLENIVSQLKGVGPVCNHKFPKCRCAQPGITGHREVNGWIAPYCFNCDGYLFPDGLGKAPEADDSCALAEAYRLRMIERETD